MSVSQEDPKFASSTMATYINIHEEVQNLWNAAWRKMNNGNVIDFEINQIEDILNRAKLLGTHSEESLRRATRLHERFKSSAKDNQDQLQDWRRFWQERLAWNEKFTTQLTQEGLRYILLVHGATAIACLNALASDKSGHARGILLFGLLSASVGMLMVAAGKIVIINLFSHQFGRLSGYLVRKRGWQASLAATRWLGLRGFRNQQWLINILIYGSIIWFGIYTLICFMWLATS